ncbi:MAG TPA: hypothetical protein VHQ47_12000 [Phycisphaerae bacterium]|nr:hypothetical protein [Phycisphaerae bacterium]
MPSSILDLLPPEYQHLWGAAAALLALLGLLLWATGVKIGRLLSALFFGLAGAALGAWLGIAALDLSPYTGGITGLAVGLILGALAYRFLLPIALALAVTGIYLRWQAPLALPQSQSAPATVQAADLEITLHSSTSPAATSPRRTPALADAATFLRHQWNALPPKTQTRTTLLLLATLVAGLVFSLLMFRRAAVVITAFLGSLALFLGLRAILLLYARPYAHYIPANPLYRYAILAGLTLLGIFIQWRFFREYTPPPRKPASSPPAPSPAK